MSYKNYLMYAACLFQALAVAGQDSTRWSLQECIDYAIAHNIQLKQNKITEEQGAADLLQKEGRTVPQLVFQYHTSHRLPAAAKVGDQYRSQWHRQQFL